MQKGHQESWFQRLTRVSPVGFEEGKQGLYFLRRQNLRDSLGDLEFLHVLNRVIDDPFAARLFAPHEESVKVSVAS
jgi:hypothetical protein